MINKQILRHKEPHRTFIGGMVVGAILMTLFTIVIVLIY